MIENSRRLPKVATAAATLAITAGVLFSSALPTFAQGPFPGRPSIDAQAFNACPVAGNYADVVAKGFGMTLVDLRKAIVSGQNFQDIATSTNTDIQTVTASLQAARKTDIDQAVKDGVMTQDEATALETPPQGRPGGGQPGPVGTAPAQGGGRGAGGNGGGPRGPQGLAANALPDISNINFLLQQMKATEAAPAPGGNGGGGNGPRGGFGGGFGGLNAGILNLVKPYDVIAQAVNLKCTDVVKTLITPPGKSMVALAADQKVDAATLTAAMKKAYTDALAQDVKDGVITQAQSDQLSANLDKAIATFINNPLPMGPQVVATQPAQ